MFPVLSGASVADFNIYLLSFLALAAGCKAYGDYFGDVTTIPMFLMKLLIYSSFDDLYQFRFGL